MYLLSVFDGFRSTLTSFIILELSIAFLINNDYIKKQLLNTYNSSKCCHFAMIYIEEENKSISPFTDTSSTIFDGLSNSYIVIIKLG